MSKNNIKKSKDTGDTNKNKKIPINICFESQEDTSIFISVSVTLNKETNPLYQLDPSYKLSQAIKDWIKNINSNGNINQVIITSISLNNISIQSKSTFILDLPQDDSINYTCTNMINLSNSSFDCDVTIQNIIFNIPDDNKKHLFNFRNSRFKHNLYIRDINFTGKTENAELSFEDARFDNNVEIVGGNFGNGKLNFFQSIMPDYIEPKPLIPTFDRNLTKEDTTNVGNFLRDIRTMPGAMYIDDVQSYFSKSFQNQTPLTSSKKLELINRILCKNLKIRPSDETDSKTKGKPKFCQILKMHPESHEVFTTPCYRQKYDYKIEHLYTNRNKLTDDDPRVNFKIINSSFSEKAIIDFSNSEFNNVNLELTNIRYLPKTIFHFEPFFETEESVQKSANIRLTLNTCNIYDSLFISNINELCLYGSKNFGAIIENSEWADIVNNNDNSSTKNNKLVKPLAKTTINSKLTIAVYNCKETPLSRDNSVSTSDDTANKCLLPQKIKPLTQQEKALKTSQCLDYLLLKENHLASGSYDEEDNAFILYMNNKAYLNYYRKHIMDKKKFGIQFRSYFWYKFLYGIGSYGISPLKALRALFIFWAIFGYFFILSSFILGPELFWLGGYFTTSYEFPDILISCLIYSAGNIVPLPSSFEPTSIPIMCIALVENFIGIFLTGYFSVAVVRKSLR